jgi:hypothetical protein
MKKDTPSVPKGGKLPLKPFDPSLFGEFDLFGGQSDFEAEFATEELGEVTSTAEDTSMNATNEAISESSDDLNPAELEAMDAWRNAALFGKASFPDQIDYYDPEQDEII